MYLFIFTIICKNSSLPEIPRKKCSSIISDFIRIKYCKHLEEFSGYLWKDCTWYKNSKSWVNRVNGNFKKVKNEYELNDGHQSSRISAAENKDEVKQAHLVCESLHEYPGCAVSWSKNCCYLRTSGAAQHGQRPYKMHGDDSPMVIGWKKQLVHV